MTESWCDGTMSVSAQGKGHDLQRGLWEMTPDVLLLILALAACLTEPVLGEDDDGSGIFKTEKILRWTTATPTYTPEMTNETWNNTFTVHEQEKDFRAAKTHAQVTLQKNSTTTWIPGRTNRTTGLTSDYRSQGNNTDKGPKNARTKGMNKIIIIAVCLILVLLLTCIISGCLIMRRRRQNNTPDPEKHDPYLDDEDGEKVPMPMFEDDMPSVMELEMEDFEKWMIQGGGDISMDS